MGTPTGIAYNSANHYMYVTNEGTNTVYVIDTTVPPTGTTITSAVDCNGNQVQNGGSTTSTSITFTVQATAGSNSIAGFQCSLDNGPICNCNTPITYNNLSTGLYTFKVQAVDNHGNVDSTPVTFS